METERRAEMHTMFMIGDMIKNRAELNGATLLVLSSPGSDGETTTALDNSNIVSVSTKNCELVRCSTVPTAWAALWVLKRVSKYEASLKESKRYGIDDHNMVAWIETEKHQLASDLHAFWLATTSEE